MKESMSHTVLRRTKFLARTLMSSPAVVFVYSPLLVAQTVVGIAVPFATGRFIDALVGGFPPTMPFAVGNEMFIFPAQKFAICAIDRHKVRG